MKPLREILGVFFCINNIMDDITKKLIEAVNKITDKKRKLPSQEEIQKLHNDADKTLKGMKDLSHLPKWVREREITESEAFGSGPPSVIPPKKTPREMTYDELEQGVSFGMNDSSEPYKQELRLRYGPSMKPLPPGTPIPTPQPKMPAYLEGKTDTAEFPELTRFGFQPATELDKLRLREKINPSTQPKIIKEMSDAEGQMAKGELEVMAKKAQELAAMMQDDTQLEAWVQSKITKAKDYISSVHDYMNGNPDKVD